jgi:hypothetical protein
MSTNLNPCAGEPLASATSDQTASPNGDVKPPSDSHDRQALLHQVLTAIHAVTQPAEFPPAWGILRPTSQVRQLRCSAAELAESLRSRFTVEQLLEVGVFEPGGGEIPTLNAELGVPSAKLRFITKDKCFHDIHSAQGALTYMDMPSVRYARMRAEKGQPDPTPILLAVNDDDVNLLSCLGHNCGWAAGLDAVCEPDIRQIFKPDALGNRCLKYRFILVGWQPADLNRRPAVLIAKILERFLDAEKLYSIDTEPLVGVWLPTPSTLSSIRLAISFQDEEKIRQILAHSLTSSVQSPAEALFTITKPPEPSYGAALRNLTQIIARCSEMPFPNQVRAAVTELEHIYDKSVIQKYYQEADATANPSKKILLLRAAELANAWHRSQSIFVSAGRVMAMETVQVPTAVSPDELKNQGRIIDELLRVLKALERLKD